MPIDIDRISKDKNRFKNQISRFLNKVNLFIPVYKSRYPFIDKLFTFLYI